MLGRRAWYLFEKDLLARAGVDVEVPAGDLVAAVRRARAHLGEPVSPPR
jgi:hypothetical protein